jgi:hypothetical protein
MAATSSPRPRRWSVVGWWALTVLTLVVLDDLTFGPAFWAISRLAGPLVAVAAIYAVYVPVQVYLVARGTSEDPGRFAGFFLRRLDLERRNAHVARNEQHLRSRVLGAGTALVGALVIGGVLPPLLLWRRGAPRRRVLRLSVATALVYATEFALLHGLLPAAV